MPGVLTLLAEVAALSRAEEGNLAYRYFQKADEQQVICLFETYRDAQALEAHRNSEHFKTLVLGQIVPMLADRKVELLYEL